ncbi:unnamed protein product [Durusdinium trenchii]|uniref:dolichyl-diphosphooligosaccharide--protein glycotransferase n=1 Tax=Durusdinium trenchii TaxID=1381693 RepID=A0ABP0IK63_9DINO
MSLSQAALAVMRINLLVVSLASAYNIRLYAVQNYGRVIHEFDPWFNYRAAEYLAEHGTERFFKWFDHTVWYPLGRPVGTTIYPGMQFAAVWIWRILEFLQQEMSLHDVCVFIPAWFGVASTVFVGLWTFECTRCVDSAVCAMLVVSILPAHLMRSVAGGFDNECMAITFMNATFYFWCRSLRNDNSWPWALLAGFSYFCMVATWGGYVYVVNIIACHAACLMLRRHSSRIHRSYSLFFLLGTLLAVQVPVVGWTPLRSLEQVAPLLQFVAVQIFEVLSTWQQRLPAKEFQLLRFRVFAVCGAVAALLGAMLFQLGYFAPLSSRVRGLFVKHRTGNPLVDSVAEHQATSPRAYWQFFHHMCTMAPLGFLISLFEMSEARNFLLLYAGITYYFSSKMNRLLLLLGPTAAALGGIALAKTLRWALHQLTQPEEAPVPATQNEEKPKHKGHKELQKAKAEGLTVVLKEIYDEFKGPLWEAYHEARWQRKASAVLMLLTFMICGMEFMNYCWAVAERLSQASIIVKRRNKEGQEILMDDYRESYWWLRDHTPEDTRIMAWWDYGYQINGLTNRTTLADGNTWNHEHIALIGRCLTGPERQAHEVIRHLADYVLIWAGDYGDDIAKSSHMARIAASVYEDVCPGDPLCSKFHRNRQTGEPSEMMSRSLLWKLYAHDPMGEVQTDGALFEEAYTSQYGLVRIFKVLNISDESKAWAADPNNWKCDAPGSWHCQGQYPPALSKVLEKQKAFQQLEDFNQQKDEKAEEYHKAYMQKVKERSL